MSYSIVLIQLFNHITQYLIITYDNENSIVAYTVRHNKTCWARNVLQNCVAIINTYTSVISVPSGGRSVRALSRIRLKIAVPRLINRTNTVMHTYGMEGRWRVCAHATRLIDA